MRSRTFEMDQIEELNNYERLNNRNPSTESRVLVGEKAIFKNNEFVSDYATTPTYSTFFEKVSVLNPYCFC